MVPTLVALAGNPNAGKTTLFNALTGARETAGNRPGVTVEVKKRRIRGSAVILADLPGLYALDTCSEEERVAEVFLRTARPDCIVNIVDATRLERNLYLSSQLLECGIPVIVALNMMDEAQQQGIRIDIPRLCKLLGAPVFPISARSGAGLAALRAACLKMQQRPPHAGRAVSPEERYRRVAEIVCRTVTPGRKSGRRNAGADTFLAGSLLGLPIFFLLMALIVYLSFDGLGAWLGGGVERLLGWSINCLQNWLETASAQPWLVSLICDGVMTGVGGVLGFLPEITLLFFFLSLLEDSGYMARTAFIADRLLGQFGLTGRAVIPVLMGFGCTVPAVMATRTLSERRERLMTVLMLPFVSCSARLPVYAMLTAAFFPAHRALVLASLYGIGFLCAAVTAAVMRFLGIRTEAGLVMELPPYRMPHMRNTLLYTAERIQHFLSRAGTIILLMSIVLWLCMNFTPALRPAVNPEDALLCRLGSFVAPILEPLGFGFWQATVALLTGLVAKEAVVSSMTLFLGVSGGTALSLALQGLFSPLSAYTFLVFVLLYAPCAATLSTIRRELGLGAALHVLMYQTVLAYMASGLVYTIGTFLLAG